MSEKYLYLCSLEKVLFAMKNITNVQNNLFGIDNMNEYDSNLDNSLLRLKKAKNIIRTNLLNQINEVLDNNDKKLFNELTTDFNKMQ